MLSFTFLTYPSMPISKCICRTDKSILMYGKYYWNAMFFNIGSIEPVICPQIKWT